MEIACCIIAIISLAFLIVLVVDGTIFKKQVHELRTGMTGKDVQQFLNKKITIIEVNENSYIGEIHSVLTIFKCRLKFIDGKLAYKILK